MAQSKLSTFLSSIRTHMSNSETPDKPFAFVQEGAGGTFAFSNAQSAGSGATDAIAVTEDYIGTRGIATCVGVYFRINVDRFFFAHIHKIVTKQGAQDLNGVV